MLICFGLATEVVLAQVNWLQDKPIVIQATKHAFLPSLREIPPTDQPERESPLSGDAPPNETRSLSDEQDLSLQISADPANSPENASVSTTPGLNILGLGHNFANFSPSSTVPSTNGAAGTTQYVQFVNDAFAVFSKSNGSLLAGPTHMNTFWAGMGGSCAPEPNMDAIAQFDKLANVWVLLMPIYTNPTGFCIAVSTTSNATGSWNLYYYEVPVNNTICHCRMMPDYAKLAVWPDAYYIMYHQAWDLNYEGPAACAVERSAMLTGAAAPTMQCFANNGSTNNGWLPSDLDGLTAPPAGSPDYLVAFDHNDQSLDLWQFHVNWTTPADSTLTGPTNIPVTSFIEPCGDGYTVFTPQDNCVPQAGTSQMLGAYGDELMYRLAYRNFGSYQSLVLNHTVQLAAGSDQTGIRWYELRNTGSGFGLHQEGTYAPDSNYRWMGSIAMDKAGDIAVGYSVSSNAMSPSIRYTGRQSTDALGTMEGEYDVLSSAGIANASQTNSVRWGDYSSMAVDPADDCTFWYTTEYQPANGGNHWSTRIASFKFPACTTQASASWTVVNTASQSANPLTSLTVPATGSGNLIAVALMSNGTTSVSSLSDNAGNTYVSAGARSTASQYSTEIWYAVNSKSGATSITPKFAGSPNNVEMTEWEVSGLATGSPDASNIASGTVTQNNTAGPAVTTSQGGDFVISALLSSADFTGSTSGNEFTDDFTTNGNGWAHLTSNAAGAGIQQASWYTASTGGVYCASTVAFLLAP